MKGGYQILDLTGATAGSPVEVKGIYKAAAGNNGKPVMILTNDGQRVYAEIAEDDGDYITCYISAEGKTVNITIEPDDSVTTVISDPGASITGLEQAVNEIAGNIGDVDDLTTSSKEIVGAVNELNSKITNDGISYTSTAGQTWQQVLNMLNDLIDRTKITISGHLEMILPDGKHVSNVVERFNITNYIQFTRVTPYGSSFEFYNIILSNNASDYYKVNNDGVLTQLGTEIVETGTTLILYYK